MKTIYDVTPTKNDLDISTYKYQTELTKKLDSINSEFNQDILNEIVLWKVNRYAKFDDKTIELLNKVNPEDEIINQNLTKDILLNLLDENQKGVRLAMASTILRFKNPKIYQIIDQRVYRFIYKKELKYSLNDINEQIKLYLDYLVKLKQVCDTQHIKFEQADRILYKMDKLYNKDLKLKY
jgi:thermostable 8-oxoguanine DNA glycosylase